MANTKKFGSQVDFEQIPVLNLVLVGSSAPSSPINGQMYYDTAANKGKLYENGAWVDIYSAGGGGGAPTGPAGGDLTGTYPNPTIGAGKVINTSLADAAVTSLKIADGTIVPGDVNPANVDGLAAAASLRTLGVGAQQAAPGNHTHTPGPSDWKESVRAASTVDVGNPAGNWTAGPLDGVSLVSGDRILLKNQTTASQNGIWVYDPTGSTRASDADTTPEVTTGAAVSVEQGTTLASTVWMLTTANPITVGTTGQTWQRIAGLTGRVNVKDENTQRVTTDTLNFLGAGVTAVSAGGGIEAQITIPGTPTGAAGGDLTGTYPDPTIGTGKVTSTHILDGTIVDGDVAPTAAINGSKLADLSITDQKVAAANKDGTAATPSMRTLGTGAQQAAAGNDARLSDARTPTAHHLTHEPGGSDPLTVDAAAATGSLRTLGTGAQQAAAGSHTHAGSAPALPIKDEGTQLTGTPTSIDFRGAGVTATVTGSDVTVTVPGGGGTSTPVRARLYLTAAQSVANDGTGVPIRFDTTDYAEPAGMADLANNAITIPEDGTYAITAGATFGAAGASGYRQVGINADGTSLRYTRNFPSASLVSGALSTMVRKFTAGQKITANAAQTGTAASALGTGLNGSALEVVKVEGAKGDKGDPGVGLLPPGQLQHLVSASGVSVANATWLTPGGWAAGPDHNRNYYSSYSSGIITMSEAGLYLVVAFAGFASGTSQRRIVRIAKNYAGSFVEVSRQDNSSVGAWVGQVTGIVPLAVGDTLEIQVWQNSGAALALAPSPGHDWKMIRLA